MSPEQTGGSKNPKTDPIAPLECLRCGSEMPFDGRRRFYEVDNTLKVVMDHPPKTLEVDLYTCVKCGKIELFS